MPTDHGRRKAPSLPAVLATGLASSIVSTAVLGKLFGGALRSEVQTFDNRSGALLKAVRTPTLDRLMDLTAAAGQPAALYPVSGLCALRWLLTDRPQDAAALGIALVGSAGLSAVIKRLVDRPRPLWERIAGSGTGSSFPSQHVVMSLATYGLIAYLVRRPRRQGRQRPRRAWLRTWGPALLLCGLIAGGRVYKGRHHASDVLGGAVAGSVWLATCCLAWASLGGGRASGRPGAHPAEE